MTMTAIRRIDVLGLRNLSNVQVLPGQGVNVFFGPNGSGKTSLLNLLSDRIRVLKNVTLTG